jgi:hypothetical protein
MQARVWNLEAYIVRQISVLCSAFLFGSVFRVHCTGTVILWQRFRC